MLLVDFTTEVGVNASMDIQRSLTYLTNFTYLQKVISPSTGRNWRQLTSTLHMDARDVCNLKQVTSSKSNGIMSSYVMAA